MYHTIIVDADSKFKATFTEVINNLHLNKYELSKGNHQTMLVERFNKYLNKILKIFVNERCSNRTYIEGALLATYAWNSSPIAGTDISKSLLVMGREYNFPIDFATDTTFSTDNSPKAIFKYTKKLVQILQQSREIYKILIDEHRSMHRDLRNSEVKFNRTFEVGDTVFARRQIQSNKAKGLVDKSQFASIGPWRITNDLKNGSYEIQSLKNPEKIEKRHASMLNLSPSEFLSLPPLHGADTSYSEIHKDVHIKRFQHAGVEDKSAGIKQPIKQNNTPNLQVLASEIATTLPHFPSVSEMDKELDEENGANPPSDKSCTDNLERTMMRPGSNSDVDQYVPLPDPQSLELEMDITVLVPKIIASHDRLFFISHAYNHHDRREWKLVQLDLESIMSLHPTALTDGKFIVNNLIQHPAESKQDIRLQRYWPYYHDKNIPAEDYTPNI